MNWLAWNVPSLNKKHTKKLRASKNQFGGQKGGFLDNLIQNVIDFDY